MALVAARTAGSKSRRVRKSSAGFTPRRLIAGGILIACTLLALNLLYQVGRKPGELLAPISGAFFKSPETTWQTYGTIFEKHATDIISPAFLGALAQVESDGNPIARPSWRWAWSWDPLEIYKPASSALGLFQITDATFAEARKHCLRYATVSMEEASGDSRSCGIKLFRTRVSANDSTETTAAYLHRSVVKALAARPKDKATLAQKQRLAAVIHLCGPKRGEQFVARGFRVRQSEQCGAHDLKHYLARIDRMKKRFARLAEQSPSPR